jgi:hypothetical protein
MIYKAVNKPLEFIMSIINGIQEVRGSTPLGSTIPPLAIEAFFLTCSTPSFVSLGTLCSDSAEESGLAAGQDHR